VSEPVEVHHVADGPPGAPVVILSHALGTATEMWEPQVPALAERFRVIRYDHRGHGRSRVPPGPYSIDDLGTDLLGLMDRLRIERASLVGLSLGAMTVLWVAATAPDRVERLVACCTLARPPSPQAWVDRAATVRRDGIAAIGDLVIERWGYTGRNREVQELLRRLLLATPAEGYAACCDAIAGLDLEPLLGRIPAPTLLVAGAEDPAAPPHGMRALGDALGTDDVAFAVIDDAAHLVNVERADAVTAAIAHHLAPLLTGGSDERRTS
jgi:3-oxoadipate enol-lactonase